MQRSDPMAAAPAGERDAARLVARLYGELRRIANRHVRHPGKASLQPTELVHEAWLRLAAPEGQWHESRPFLCAAGKAMRSILVDHARARTRLKREAPGRCVPLDELCESFTGRAIDLIALDAALTELAGFDPVMAQAVELRFFVGLDVDQVAAAIDMPQRTFQRRWATTRAWLHRRVR